MNNQEILDKVWGHFVTGRARPGVDQRGVCVYRSDMGTTCAIGCLIPADEQFVPLHRYGADVILMLDSFPHLVQEALGEVDVEFLEVMQLLHDRAAITQSFHETLEEQLRSTARMWRLKVPR